ncbi:MAG: hypothetical protein QM796_00735 [Chthoniobacteraceae bacterium]
MKLNGQIRRSESGMTMIMVLIVMIVMLVCLGGAMEYTSTIRRNVQRSNERQAAVAIADGALEIAYANWRQIATTAGTSSAPTVASLSSLSSVTINSSYYPAQTISSTSYGVPTYSGTYSVKAVDPRINPTAYPITSGTPPPAYGQDAAAAFANTGSATTYTSSYYYLANASVTMNTLKGSVSANVNRIFELQKTSPWNWAIFYANDLEIHPGGTMNVTGWVHSNGNLYTGHSSLNFIKKVTYVGNWTVGFSPNENDHSGETPASPTYPSNLPPTKSQSYEPFGIDTSTFNTTNTNPNDDSYHEIVEMPTVGYTDPMTTTSDKARYFSQAGIKVVIGTGGSMTIYNSTAPTTDSSGVITSLGTTVSSTSTGNDKLIYNAITSAVSPQASSIQDNREAATMTVTDVDISKLVTAVNTTSNLFNGSNVLYIVDTTNSTTSRKAIRLKNGATLPTNGLTVVSANAVYVQGDYNTGSTSTTYSSSTQPASNASTSVPTSNTVSGYDLAGHPAAVVADAVTILSNAWADANSTLAVGLRPATNTTINSAIISGIAPSSLSGYSGGNSYSGGAENFPRLLEDWGGKYFTYYGSMVELYPSNQSTGRWGNSNVYGVPTRQWYFNTNFYTNPPPGTTTLVRYNRGQWFVQ